MVARGGDREREGGRHQQEASSFPSGPEAEREQGEKGEIKSPWEGERRRSGSQEDQRRRLVFGLTQRGKKGRRFVFFSSPGGKDSFLPFFTFHPPSPLRVNPRIPLMTERGSLQPLSSPDFIRGIISAATLQVSLKDREGGSRNVGEPRLKTRWEERCFPIPLPFFEEWFFEGGQTVPIFAKSISRNFPFEPIYAMKVANFE